MAGQGGTEARNVTGRTWSDLKYAAHAWLDSFWVGGIALGSGTLRVALLRMPAHPHVDRLRS